MALSETTLSVPMPEFLAQRLRLQAARECSSVASVARRLIALGVARETPEPTERDPRALVGAAR